MGQADVLSRPLASSRVSRGNPIRSAEVDPDRPLEPSDEIDAGRCKVTPVCGVQMKLSLAYPFAGCRSPPPPCGAGDSLSPREGQTLIGTEREGSSFE